MNPGTDDWVRDRGTFRNGKNVRLMNELLVADFLGCIGEAKGVFFSIGISYNGAHVDILFV